jgi:hypothetical protein
MNELLSGIYATRIFNCATDTVLQKLYCGCIAIFPVLSTIMLVSNVWDEVTNLVPPEIA